MRKRKILSTIIILMGLVIVAYPKASELYYNHQQEKFIEEWEQSLLDMDTSDIDDEEEEVYEPSEANNHQSPEDIEIEKRNKEEKRLRDKYIKDNMEGMLRIDKINLNLPVLKGDSNKNLKMSLASIKNTGEPGGLGNYAIAGHRNRTYGRNFNRLDEVKVGDIIELGTGEEKYKYTVSEKLYVKPDEVWVLYGSKKDREITLVTCHPMGKSTHRLIIKGKVL